MKAVSLLLPIAILAVVTVFFLPDRSKVSDARSADGQLTDASMSFDEFVDRAGIDVNTMSVGLGREAVMSGRQRSLPLCALSEKQAESSISPFDAYAEGVGLDVSELGVSNEPRDISKPVPTIDELSR